MRTTWKHGLAFAAALGLGLPAMAQDSFPTRPITMLVGFAAGGGTDVVGRRLAQEMEGILGQPVVVVNRPGGGGLVSWQELVAGPADGYTTALFLPVNAFIQRHLSTSESWIDPLEDVRVVGMFNEDPWGFAASVDAPFDDAPGFAAWSREAGNDARVSAGGPATAYHWAWVGLAAEADARVRIVTYQGGTSAGLRAVAGGEVVAAGAGPGESASMVDAGLLRQIGIASRERMEAFPDVPTFREQGIDFTFGITRGLAVPAGTPDAAVEILADAVARAYASEGFQEFLATAGFGPGYMSAEESRAYLVEQDALFREMMAREGVLRP